MQVRPLQDWMDGIERSGLHMRPREQLQVSAIEAEPPTVLVDSLGTPAALRVSLARLGDTLREQEPG